MGHDSYGQGQPGCNGLGGISGTITNINGGGGGGGLLGNGGAKQNNSGYQAMPLSMAVQAAHHVMATTMVALVAVVATMKPVAAAAVAAVTPVEPAVNTPANMAVVAAVVPTMWEPTKTMHRETAAQWKSHHQFGQWSNKTKRAPAKEVSAKRRRRVSPQRAS